MKPFIYRASEHITRWGVRKGNLIIYRPWLVECRLLEGHEITGVSDEEIERELNLHELLLRPHHSHPPTRPLRRRRLILLE